jgi:predicted nuclease of restriction endonuclease-like RecB superfamily
MSLKLRNKFERELYAQLQRSGLYFEYEPGRLPYVVRHYYVPDFIVELSDGRRIYIEAKGYFRPEHKVKMRAVKEQHPNEDIRLVFNHVDGRNIKWAEKYGFPWACGRIPDEWLYG